MATDISRKLFDKTKHYSGVVQQQGRVTLDADMNEQLDIHQYRTHTETKDVIGKSGVPKKDNGFLIGLSDSLGITIASGRIYVGGLLCELEKGKVSTNYQTQPYYPDPDMSYFFGSPPGSPPASPVLSPPLSPVNGSHLNIEDGVYVVYIEAWQREVTFLDNPLIQEVALGEADTTGRLQTVWQVKLWRAQGDNLVAATCKSIAKPWYAFVSATTGTLNARTKKGSTSSDPCSIKPGAGFRGLENQLYRVEVQGVDSAGHAFFKWSRDNSSFETIIESVDGSVVTVAITAKDDVFSFAPGQWVEVVDESSALNSKPHPLVSVTHVDHATREITLNTSVIQYAGKKGLKLRRWDQKSNAGDEKGISIGAGWIELEDGIEVQFSNGTYRAGDYWLIPARTATAEIEWPPFNGGVSSDEQPPAGVKRFYAQLAMLKANDGMITLEDCRKLFPSLTEICAEDICFNNDTCDLSEAQNVQEALDLLCAANDLRDHNKHLHGYGVVCGLKVTCGITREFVEVESGYALDCEGNIIKLKRAGLNYNIVAEAATAGLLDSSGNGVVCLSIAYKGKTDPSLSIEKYVQKPFWEEVFEGSLIKDFFDENIKPLIEFVKAQLPIPLTDGPPVAIGQQQLTALINLLFQLINSSSGPYIFLSGNPKRKEDCFLNPKEKQNEDQLLYCLYQQIRMLLASETYCAMFDKDHPFPKYTIDPGLDTIFGPTLKFHRRLRIHPEGRFAYTCGMDNKIYVYDLSTRLFHQTLVFPSTPNIKLQDIAVSSDGKELYAVGLLDDKDSIIAAVTIDVTTGKHAWINGSSVKCAFKYVSLAVSKKFGLHALAKSRGLYRLSGVGTPTFTETQVSLFNGTGLLYISDDFNTAFAARATIAGETTHFNQIFSVDLSTLSPFVYPMEGEDGANDLLVERNKLYVTGNGASGAIEVRIFTLNTLSFTSVPLESGSALRLGIVRGNSPHLLISFSNKYKVMRMNLDSNIVDLKYRIPVQLFPMAMAVNPKGDTVYVLNAVVNTLTMIDVERSFATPRPNFTEEPPLDIADYHDAVILAYKDLFGHFLQYLKDAFCEKFIVDCPVCTEKNKVYLGCVEIRGRKVYHICNFSKRKYVKTFPTWEYWLSTVPVLPALKILFTKFCCSVIDD